MPLVSLVALAVVLRIAADPSEALVGSVVGSLVAAAWLDRVMPGHRSSRLGRPRWWWLGWVAAVLVVHEVAEPLMGDATWAITMAAFLGGGVLISARNDYGRTA